TPGTRHLFLFRALRSFRAVLRTSLLSISHADRVQRSANHVISHAGQILDAAATDQNDRVLLQIVANARNVGRNFNSIGQTDTSNLAQRRIRFLRRLRVDACTDASFLRRTLERRAGRFVLDLLATFANKLIDSRHLFSSLPTLCWLRVTFEFDAQKGAYLPLSGTRG